MSFYCQDCGKKDCKTIGELAAHYRKAHPGRGYSMWDIAGDLGDDFANSALEEQSRRFKACGERLTVAEAKVKQYEALMPKYEALVRMLHAVELAAENARAAWPKAASGE